MKGGVGVCLRMSTFARVCLRLLAFSPLRLLAFVSVCLSLFAFARICLRPPSSGPPLHDTDKNTESKFATGRASTVAVAKSLRRVPNNACFTDENGQETAQILP